MSGLQPVAVYSLRIPPGNVLFPAVPGFAAMFRLTMAAIDPSAEPEREDADDKSPPRATLKIVRLPDIDDEESDDEDYLDMDDEDEEDSDDEEANGGPSNKTLRKQQLLEALAADEEDEDEDEDMDDDDDDDEAAAAEIIKQLTKASKGKGKAIAGNDEDEDDDEEDSEEGEEMDEVVLCTLDTEKNYNQPLDFVVNEGEKIFFTVTGTHTVHLTGNYVMPIDDGQASLYDDEDEEEDYDLSPDEDELDLLEEDEESDELDDMEDPRVTEVASDDEVAPKLVTVVKGKNKRPADDLEAGEDLDALIAKSVKKDEVALNGETKKLSKAEKKAAKKVKKNDGEAVPAATPEKKAEATTNGSEKKTVQFAKNLEQGPTPSVTPPTTKKETKEEVKKSDATKTTSNVRNVNGVTVDDRKVGSGPAAKKNSKVEMRYIGKLENGKVFDSNKSGKPFAFKLGTGEVIKGWDVGLEGISAGGERRITIPSNLAYGNKALPGIPKNSKLIFDVKCLSVK